MTETTLINLITDGGAFALAVFLVVYVMRESAKREARASDLLEKYAARMEDLCTQLKLVGQRLESIEDRLPSIKGKE